MSSQSTNDPGSPVFDNQVDNDVRSQFEDLIDAIYDVQRWDRRDAGNRGMMFSMNEFKSRLPTRIHSSSMIICGRPSRLLKRRRKISDQLVTHFLLGLHQAYRNLRRWWSRPMMTRKTGIMTMMEKTGTAATKKKKTEQKIWVYWMSTSLDVTPIALTLFYFHRRWRAQVVRVNSTSAHILCSKSTAYVVATRYDGL